MYKDVLRSIEGIEIFPVISFVLFTAIFCFILGYTFTMSKRRVDTLSALPLEDGTDAPVNIQRPS